MSVHDVALRCTVGDKAALLPNAVAAGIAAQAAQYALLGYPVAMVKQVGANAVEAHGLAMDREVGRRSLPEQRVEEVPAVEHPQS